MLQPFRALFSCFGPLFYILLGLGGSPGSSPPPNSQEVPTLKRRPNDKTYEPWSILRTGEPRRHGSYKDNLVGAIAYIYIYMVSIESNVRP